MSRRDSTDDFDPIDETRRQLTRSGWTIGVAVHYDVTAAKTWVVTGRNGETSIRAEGATRALAWRRALDWARDLEMLGT